MGKIGRQPDVANDVDEIWDNLCVYIGQTRASTRSAERAFRGEFACVLFLKQVTFLDRVIGMDKHRKMGEIIDLAKPYRRGYPKLRNDFATNVFVMLKSYQLASGADSTDCRSTHLLAVSHPCAAGNAGSGTSSK